MKLLTRVVCPNVIATLCPHTSIKIAIIIPQVAAQTSSLDQVRGATRARKNDARPNFLPSPLRARRAHAAFVPRIVSSQTTRAPRPRYRVTNRRRMRAATTPHRHRHPPRARLLLRVAVSLLLGRVSRRISEAFQEAAGKSSERGTGAHMIKLVSIYDQHYKNNKNNYITTSRCWCVVVSSPAECKGAP